MQRVTFLPPSYTLLCLLDRVVVWPMVLQRNTTWLGVGDEAEITCAWKCHNQLAKPRSAHFDGSSKRTTACFAAVRRGRFWAAHIVRAVSAPQGRLGDVRRADRQGPRVLLCAVWLQQRARHHLLCRGGGHGKGV